MHALTRASLANRALIALVSLSLFVFGVISMMSLKRELIPDVSFPIVAVQATYQGATPEAVDTDVTRPLERGVQAVEGVETTTATSSPGSAMIQIEFRYGTDLTTAEAKVNQIVQRLRSQLPDSVDPVVLAGSISDLPIVQIAASSPEGASALAGVLEERAVPKLERVAGVREASVEGAPTRQVQITPDQAALASRGLSVQAIGDALDASNKLIPVGSVDDGAKTLSVQAGARMASVDEIASLPLLGATMPTTVGQVAKVALGDAAATSVTRVNGEDALVVSVTKTPEGNTVDVAHGVHAAVDELRDELPGVVEFSTVFDQAPYIERSIASLTEEGALGLGMAVLVILVFLLSVRSTIVTAISIPASLMLTFIAMQVPGYTLNILTLGAITIAIGRVVDDSIVVIENINRHLRASTSDDRAKTILRAVGEVAGAISASTFATIAVFLPLAFVEGSTGEMFRPFALTQTIALLSSLLVALTIVPVLAYWMLRGRRYSPSAEQVVRAEEARRAERAELTGQAELAGRAERAEPGERAAAAEPSGRGDASGAAARSIIEGEGGERDRRSWLQRAYRPIVAFGVRRPLVTVIAAVLVLGATVAMTPLLKQSFIGDSGQDTISVSQTLPAGTSLGEQNEAATVVESAFRQDPDVETVLARFGRASSFAAAFGTGSTRVQYSITARPGADATALKGRLVDFAKSRGASGEVTISQSGGFGSSDIAVDIQAPTEDDLHRATEAFMREVSGRDGIGTVTSNLTEATSFVQVRANRALMAQAGVSESVIGGLIAQRMSPVPIGEVSFTGTQLQVVLEPVDPPRTLEALRALQVPTNSGPVPITQLASIEQTTQPASITSKNGVETATVTIAPSGDDLATATRAVASAIADAQLPQGATAEIGGVASDQSDAFSQLGLALLIAVLIVYIIMVATFKSLLQPLLLLVSIPFAATGALALLLITDTPLGVPSIIGMLMLVGIVVTNAIVLVDLVNQYRARGLSVREALIEGGSRRLRPILMTALATIMALVPMALGVTGNGGFISRPLAIVVIGGLLSSTLLTLLVLPALYALVETPRERRRARREAARERELEHARAGRGAEPIGGAGPTGGAGPSRGAEPNGGAGPSRGAGRSGDEAVAVRADQRADRATRGRRARRGRGGRHAGPPEAAAS